MKFPKKIKVLGKTLPTAALAVLVMAGAASATLLAYYGQITGTFSVQQSVVVDNGQQVSDSMSGALGGETFCFEHNLQNFASVPATVNLNNDNADNAVTVSYNGVANGPFATVAQSGVPGDFTHGTITVEDLGNSYRWTFTITDSAPHYGVGLQISEDGVTPAFQVYFAEFGDSQWHYQPWTGTGWNGWGGVDTTTLPAGISATGNGSGNTFTITIDKSLVGAPYWASQLRTLLLGVYPAGFSWGPTYAFQSVYGTALSNPITLQSGQTLQFNDCYQFAINTATGTYTITTQVVPSQS